MIFKVIKVARNDLTNILFVNSKRNIVNYRLSNNSRISVVYASNKNNLLNENKRQVNKYYINESRNFVSLAWLGLWGKTPAKNSEPLKEEEAILKNAQDQTPNSSADAPTTPSSVTDAATDTSLGYIPEPPPIVDENIILNALGEPTLHSLGLGSYFTPVGWFQMGIEAIHVNLGLGWFESIAMFAIILRICLLPITVKSQKVSGQLRKLGPEMAHFNEKMNDARMSGNSMEYMRTVNEFQQYMKMNNLSIYSYMTPFLQFPFVISAFIAIRKMCNYPVESFTTGGAFWFTDLTATDPTFILPIVSTASILAIVYKGIDTGMSADQMKSSMKYLVYGLSAVSFPFFIFMPSGVMVYVCATNAFSLASSFVFRNESVKKALGIPILTPYEIQRMKDESKKKKGFFEGITDSIDNRKLMSELKEREELQMKKFGQGARIQTFKTDPTKKIAPKK